MREKGEKTTDVFMQTEAK